MTIQNEIELKLAFTTLDKLIAEMGDSETKQAQARLLAESIQRYEKEHVSFPIPTTLIPAPQKHKTLPNGQGFA